MKEKSHKKAIVTVTLSALFTLIGGGTVLFHALEDWTWIQSFYFTIVTITTVGYGDLHPTTDAARLFTAIYILFGVSIGAGIITYYGSNAMKRRVKKRISKQSIVDKA